MIRGVELPHRSLSHRRFTMPKATLLQTWEFVKQHALPPDGLISFRGVSDRAMRAGITPQKFRLLATHGFLRVKVKTQGDSRVYYTINPAHPPVEQLAEYDRLKGW
jgi:hypothetical protein